MLTHALEKRLVEEFDLQDVDTLGFYRAVFPSGCLEETGNQKPGKYNAMVRAIMPDDKNQYILCVHDDLEQLTNISFTRLDYAGAYYVVSEVLGTLPEMTADMPLVTWVSFPGTMTTYGISFTDSYGDYRTFAILTSGKDGSLIFEEYE